MAFPIYIEPRDNPEYFYRQVLNDINTNFSGITSGGTGSSTYVQNGLNTYTGGTSSSPTVNISAATLTSLFSTSLSGGTLYSGSTPLDQIFALSGATGGPSTFIQNGTNTYTGGTTANPTVNISAATLNNLTVSGASTMSTITATTISATTHVMSPLLIGGVGTGSSITYLSTISTGDTTGTAHLFKGGTSGATTLLTMLNDGRATFQNGVGFLNNGNLNMNNAIVTNVSYVYGANSGGANLTLTTNNSTGNLIFASNTLIENARLTYGGNFLIGTTTDSGYKLDVTGSTRIGGATTLATVSATTYISGTTNLYDIFLLQSSSGTSASLWSASTGVSSIIANNGSGNVASGVGSFAGGSGNTASGGLSSVVGGRSSNASNTRTFIGNGYQNTASETYSVVVGGKNNTNSGSKAFLGGGDSNVASGTISVIGGGVSNTASGQGSLIGTGLSNKATSTYSTVLNGRLNSATTTAYATIVSGLGNLATGGKSFIGAGQANIASGNYGASVVGGRSNTASGTYSFVGAGYKNSAIGAKSAVLGGRTNSATTTGTYASIGGGLGNVVSASLSFIGGGRENQVTVAASFIGGGKLNTVSGNTYSSIVGGLQNTASGSHSSVLNGSGNTAAGARSAVIGGQSISGGSDDTVYVPYLNIRNIFSGTPIINIGIDALGNVVTGTTGGGPGGASTYVQPGLNTYTGGTDALPTINISAATLTYLSATTISATTYYGIPSVFGVGADGQGGVLTTGVTAYRVMDTSGRITGWDIVSTITGNCVFDVWKVSGGVLPTVLNTIIASGKPTLTGALFSSSTAINTWTAATFSAGDIIGFNLDSVTGITKANLNIRYLKS